MFFGLEMPVQDERGSGRGALRGQGTTEANSSQLFTRRENPQCKCSFVALNGNDRGDSSRSLQLRK
jgi:hypothetical protein